MQILDFMVRVMQFDDQYQGNELTFLYIDYNALNLSVQVEKSKIRSNHQRIYTIRGQ